MKASVTFAFFLLLATATRIQKVNGASSGETPLIKAVKSNNVNLVKRLLEIGVDAKATDRYGASALMWAAMNGNPKSVELLLPLSDVQATNNYGYTALDYAKSSGYSQIVRLLQQYSN